MDGKISSNAKPDLSKITVESLAALVDRNPVEDECMVMNAVTFPRLVELLKREHEFSSRNSTQPEIAREKLANPKGTMMYENQYVPVSIVLIMNAKQDTILRIVRIPMKDKK